MVSYSGGRGDRWQRHHRLGAGLLFVISLLAAGPATAQRAEDEELGRRHYHVGEERLNQGHYREAIEAFEAGYAAAPRPAFLLDIGNCYRKLGELGKARTYYWRFLDTAPKNHPSRPDVIGYLRAIEQINADGVALDQTVAPHEANGGAPRWAAVPPAPLPPDSTAVLVAPAPVAVRQPSATTPLYRRWWFWAALGGAAAGAVVVGMIAASGGHSGCTASLGCLHE